MLFWLQMCGFEKQRNRDTISSTCHDFGYAESMFCWCIIVARFWENVTRFSACWARFQDKVGRTLGRTYQTCHDLDKRDTILTAEDCYISVSLQILKESLKREKLGLQRR